MLSEPSFLFDEDVDTGLAKALEHRSISVITTQQAGNLGYSDYQQLIYAKEQHRIIITHNTRDFMVLHKSFLESDRSHCGIIVCRQRPIGVLLKEIMKLNARLDEYDMENRIEFLSTYS